MRITFPKRIQEDSYVAVSGGVDSVVLLDNVVRLRRNPTVVHFIHDDAYAETELNFVQNLANAYSLKFIVGEQKRPNEVGESKEKAWREERYKFFTSFDRPVYVGATLDDAVEWYIMTCLRGEGHYVDYSNRNVEKPLVLTRKSLLYEYAKKFDLAWMEDPSNHTGNGLRSRIRKSLMSEIEEIEPGIFTTVKKRILYKLKGESL